MSGADRRVRLNAGLSAIVAVRFVAETHFRTAGRTRRRGVLGCSGKPSRSARPARRLPRAWEARAQ
jgi:hypothetical protein